MTVNLAARNWAAASGQLSADRGASLLELDPGLVGEAFNQRSFEVRHRLATHDLFTLPRLVKLAKATADLRPADVYFDAGDIAIEQRWSESPKLTDPVDEVIGRIEHANAWIILRRTNLDPEYGALMASLMAEVTAVAGRRITKHVVASDMIVFIASPMRVTTYHIDRECSFLFQIRGNKEISVFDQNDRDVLPEQEIERFWTVDTNAARYKPHLQYRAKTALLQPGGGVHIPVNAPHWLRNGGDVSISVNINVVFSGRERANMYRANYYLRKFGVTPTPPRQSRTLDALKSSLGATAHGLYRLYHRGTSSRR